ncbi:hypothetical protein GCM10009710_33580 [Aeromicrobium alkaliterrae]|uniref:Uncharacterized protein n=1 Tax=Aeromicrobium alkaliterrae TaxID=302168 RepID=A0ABN2K9F4_9ACTN
MTESAANELLTLDRQADLRATGLVATPQERWADPTGTFYRSPLRTGPRPGRRQQQNRPTRLGRTMNRRNR